MSNSGENLYTYTANNPVNLIDPDGNFALSIFITSVVVGALIGAGLGWYSAVQNDSDILTGIIVGALIGAAVGAVAGATFAGGGAGYLMGGLSSVGNKIISDTASSIFFGTNNFGTWEDYAIAFIIGGLIKGKDLTGTTKWFFDSVARPGLNQLAKWGSRNASLSGERFLYDVAIRTVSFKVDQKMNVYGLELNPSKAIVRGWLSGLGKVIYALRK